jgi:hypothetical protein
MCCAVAADDDEEPRAFARRALGEADDVTRSLARQRPAAQAGGRRLSLELGPPAPRRTVRRCRVDEEDDAAVVSACDRR